MTATDEYLQRRIGLTADRIRELTEHMKPLKVFREKEVTRELEPAAEAVKTPPRLSRNQHGLSLTIAEEDLMPVYEFDASRKYEATWNPLKKKIVLRETSKDKGVSWEFNGETNRAKILMRVDWPVGTQSVKILKVGQRWEMLVTEMKAVKKEEEAA
jgi:hypothetical protein